MAWFRKNKNAPTGGEANAPLNSRESEPVSDVSRPSSAATQPEGLRLPDDLNLGADREQRLRDVLWHEVLMGVTDPDELLEAVDIEDDIAELDDDVIHRASRAVIEARRAQQASLQPSRIHTAFAELAEIGVLARAHFTCCGTCGSTEIYDELDDSRTWRGYVFFHQQDTEQLIEDGTTYLSYGVFLPAWISEAEWTELASDAERDAAYMGYLTPLLRDEVLPVLERHGMTVTWDGTHHQRVLLQNADYYVAI